MTRRKVEIKKIENKSSRQVAFSKRRKGLLKKAQDLSVLCDADVAVIVFSNRGRLYDFCSAQSFPEMLQRYWDGVGENSIKNAYEVEDGSSRITSIQKCAELLQMLNRNLEEQSIGKLSVTELVKLENQLDDARQEIISRKTKLQLESVAALHEQEKKLLKEKKLLQQEIADMKEMKKAGESVEELIQKDCGGLDDHQPQQLVTLDLLR